MTIEGRHIVVAGPMASGKTTLGHLLADRLDRRFIDSDEQVKRRFGMTGREVEAKVGVGGLHVVEVEALITALAADSPSVIAAAASVADSEDAIEALSQSRAVIILLESPVPVLVDRIPEGDHRRPISEMEFGSVSRHRRRALLALEPAAVLHTARLDPDAVLQEALRSLE